MKEAMHVNLAQEEALRQYVESGEPAFLFDSEPVFDPAQKRPHKRAPRTRTVAEKVAALEKKIERQEDVIEELKLRLNSGSSQERPDDVVRHMESAFRELDHVIQVHYDVQLDGTWHVVVVHVLDDKGEALLTICDKSIEIQDALRGVEIETLVLHEDEVRDEHLAGAKLVFSRPRR